MCRHPENLLEGMAALEPQESELQELQRQEAKGQTPTAAVPQSATPTPMDEIASESGIGQAETLAAVEPMELGDYKSESKGGLPVTAENAHDAWDAFVPHLQKVMKVYGNLNSGTGDMGNASGDLVRASWDFRGKGVMIDADGNPDTPDVDAGEWLYERAVERPNVPKGRPAGSVPWRHQPTVRGEHWRHLQKPSRTPPRG